MCSSLNSLMLMTVMFDSSPKSSSASASAVSVLPTPLVPASRNTPVGRLGSVSPARDVRIRSAITANACDWPTTRSSSLFCSSSTPRISSDTMRPTGMPVHPATTSAIACPSTQGLTSGVSPCTFLSCCSRPTSLARSVSCSASGSGATPSAGCTAAISVARSARICSTSFDSSPKRASSAASVVAVSFFFASSSVIVAAWAAPAARSRLRISISIVRASIVRRASSIAGGVAA